MGQYLYSWAEAAVATAAIKKTLSLLKYGQNDRLSVPQTEGCVDSIAFTDLTSRKTARVVRAVTLGVVTHRLCVDDGLETVRIALSIRTGYAVPVRAGTTASGELKLAASEHHEISLDALRALVRVGKTEPWSSHLLSQCIASCDAMIFMHRAKNQHLSYSWVAEPSQQLSDFTPREMSELAGIPVTSWGGITSPIFLGGGWKANGMIDRRLPEYIPYIQGRGEEGRVKIVV